ncbi:uncharacterized protein Dmul_19410 [Desulfococcus multivorans]|nr:uncharacterized protein Dmul_19410 [Desulfococcus multivorans]
MPPENNAAVRIWAAAFEAGVIPAKPRDGSELPIFRRTSGAGKRFQDALFPAPRKNLGPLKLKKNFNRLSVFGRLKTPIRSSPAFRRRYESRIENFNNSSTFGARQPYPADAASRRASQK